MNLSVSQLRDALQAHATTLCVEVRFAASLNDQRVASLRAVPFKQIRHRLYILKQKFDDEHPQPSVPLMPLVETTNLATIMYVSPPIGFSRLTTAEPTIICSFVVPHVVLFQSNRLARCQINASADITEPWTAALASFGSKASAAIAAIAPTRGKYQLPCPVRTLACSLLFLCRSPSCPPYFEKIGCVLSLFQCLVWLLAQAGEVCDDLAALSKAWVCEAARANSFEVEACAAGKR